MPAKYSIIQYTPDVVTDERINIGVVVFDQNTVLARFLSNWGRVRRFANQDIKFLDVFAKDFAAAASPALLEGLEPFPKLDPEEVTRIIGKWNNTIQFTAPRGSLKPAKELLNEIASRFLSEPVSTQRKYRDRRDAARIASYQIRRALVDQVGAAEAEDLLKHHAPLQGRFQRHKFDAIVANGVPYLAAHGLSFELPEAQKLQTHVDAMAWSIKDVRDFDGALPIGVITLPPKTASEGFERLKELHDQTISIYKKLGATILSEEEVEPWAEDVVKSIHFNRKP